MTSVELSAFVNATALKYNLPTDLLMAQVQVESSGDPYALRYEPKFFQHSILNNPNAKAGQYGPFAACSLGLMQLLVETAYEIGYVGEPWGLFDPAVNLDFGGKQMAALMKRTDDYRTALAAYNAGLGNLTAGLSYADKVFARARRGTQ